MTVTAWDLALYAGALFILFLTPGPVWLALIARAVSGGFEAAWPLAVGVAVGDIVWPLVAILGISWIGAEVDGVLTGLKWLAALIFAVLGIFQIRAAGAGVQENPALLRPGRIAGFTAGVAVILGNPKAILFYMGVLPGFFDLSGVGGADMLAIVVLSFVVPLLGNLCFAAFVDRTRYLISSAGARRRLNVVSGVLLLGVAVLVLLT